MMEGGFYCMDRRPARAGLRHNDALLSSGRIMHNIYRNLLTLPLALAMYTSPAYSDDTTEVSEYAWHAGTTPAGETTITRAGDGRVSNESFVHWNNREYRLQSELQLDQDGLITSLHISGVSPFGAPVEETFGISGEQASWQTRGEGGQARSGQGAFYVSTEWGAVAALEALVRAASRRIDGTIPTYPSGNARVERLLDTVLEVNGTPHELSLYAIHGLDFSPIYGWFNNDLQLVARDMGRMGMVPVGWGPQPLHELARIQAEQDGLYAQRLSARHTHKPGKPVLFSNVDVIDVAAGELLEDRFVLVSEGRITAVSAESPDTAGALVIDGSGKTLLPGLWDMHGHFDLGDGLLNIAGGITSVRDLGSTHERIMEAVDKFDRGVVIGPHTYRAAMIDQVGPYANRNPVASLDEALALIDRFAAQGYLQIKLYSSIDPAWVPAIAGRTHQHGMRLSGHVPAYMSAEQAVRAGFDEIQHINMVFLNFLVGDTGDTRQQIRFTTYGNEGGQLNLASAPVREFIDLLLAKGVVVDPTAAIFESMMLLVPGQPDPTYASIAEHLPLNARRELYNPSFEIGAEREQAWAATAQRQGEMLKLLWQSGVPLVAGSDGMPAFTLQRELEYYVQVGLPNAAVLELATLGSARVVGVSERTGSIAVGKDADLLLLDGNPLQDINAIRRATLVMKGESLFRPDQLFEAVGVKPFVASEVLP
jgi:hypothetical protein